jgi:glutamate synthase domain-containing protein 1
MLCHNGEINTIAGNANRMHAREGRLGLATAAEEALFRPAIEDAGSDPAILDETVETLSKEGGVRGVGRDIRRAIAMVVPAAWDAPDMDQKRRGFLLVARVPDGARTVRRRDLHRRHRRRRP